MFNFPQTTETSILTSIAGFLRQAPSRLGGTGPRTTTVIDSAQGDEEVEATADVDENEVDDSLEEAVVGDETSEFSHDENECDLSN